MAWNGFTFANGVALCVGKDTTNLGFNFRSAIVWLVTLPK